MLFTVIIFMIMMKCPKTIEYIFFLKISIIQLLILYHHQ